MPCTVLGAERKCTRTQITRDSELLLVLGSHCIGQRCSGQRSEPAAETLLQTETRRLGWSIKWLSIVYSKSSSDWQSYVHWKSSLTVPLKVHFTPGLWPHCLTWLSWLFLSHLTFYLLLINLSLRGLRTQTLELESLLYHHKLGDLILLCVSIYPSVKWG